MNDPSDLEEVHPEPVLGFDNFFYFPDDKRLGVSRDGKIVNIHTGNLLKPQLSGNGTVGVIITSPGKKPVCHKFSRLIAKTFIGRPSRHLDKSFSNLEVNHCDGNQLHNLPDNLEWCTGKENVEHARLSGFMSDNKPIAVKYLGLEPREFLMYSLREFSERFEVHPATVSKCLRKGLNFGYHVDYHAFKYADGNPWPILDLKKMTQLGEGNIVNGHRTGGYRKIVCVKDIVRKLVTIYNSLTEAIKETGHSYDAVNHQVRRKGFAKIADLEYSYL